MTELVWTSSLARPMATPLTPAITMRGLSVAFGAHPVLADVALDLPAGQVTAVVGPSGSGKSTLLTAINRLVDLIPGARVDGQVRVGPRDVRADATDVSALRRQVGQLFQRPTPFPCSIRRNLELPLREHGGHPRAELPRQVERLLRAVGLWTEVATRLEAAATTLSGGQQQRLCLARALATAPEVLLLDEPSSALDPAAAAHLERLIASLRGRLTIVLVTHNLAQARRLADHVALLWPGAAGATIVAQGSAARFFAGDDPRVRAFLASEVLDVTAAPTARPDR